MPMGQYQNGNLGSAGEIGKYAVRFVCGWNMAMFSSVHVRSTLIPYSNAAYFRTWARRSIKDLSRVACCML